MLKIKMALHKYIRTISFITLLAGVSATVSAKRVSINLNGRESSGFNALDYVLQKPLPADTFPADDKGFGNHFFIGAGGGVSMIGNSFSGSIKPGFRLGGQLGSWFTPVHGIRLGADVGLLSVHQGISRTWFGALRADYLLNMSALLRGYDPNRKFELISAVGLEYQRLRQKGIWGNNIGLGAALQMRLNVGQSFYIFAEPRLAVLTGRRYDGTDDWRRMRADMSLNVGLGYRILQGNMRKLHSTPFQIKNDDRLYFGVGGGLWCFPRNSFNPKNPFGEAFVGKMFSSTSGLQFTMGFNQLRRGEPLGNKYLGTASLDYILNLGNAFGGYSPRDVFQTQLNLGLSGAMVTGEKGRVLAPGVSLGLTGLFRLSDNWGIFIHPQMYVFSRKITQNMQQSLSPLAAVDLGLRYTIGDFSRLMPESYTAFNNDPNRWFVSAGFGYAHRYRGNFGHGVDAYVGFGKRFTPVSSWRVQLVGDVYSHSPRLYEGAIHVDYLSSITTAMYGYDPERLFDLQMVLGVNAGVARYNGPMKATVGLEGGFQANFRLNEHLDLYVEPQFLAVCGPTLGNARGWFPELRAQIGLRYRLGNGSKRTSTQSDDTQYADERNFISIAAGPLAFSGAILQGMPHITGGLDVAAGRWFTNVSGVRLTYANDWIHRDRKDIYIGSAHVNYLLNITSLIDRNPYRHFHIIGAIGGGLGISPKAHTKVSGMAYGGVQFRYNLPSNIDLHIEPGLEFWPNRLIPNPTSASRFEFAGKLSVGASYRF